MDNTEKIKQAKGLGAKAFWDGKKCVPAHDQEFMKLLEGMKVGEGASDIAQSWLDGWHRENLMNTGDEWKCR